jgi:hypothetical protein
MIRQMDVLAESSQGDGLRQDSVAASLLVKEAAGLESQSAPNYR